jgi:tetratricopeptide (TPR) repeat protein
MVLLGSCAERSFELNEEGLAAYQRGDLDAAEASFEAALAEDPGNHEIVLNLALTLHARGEYRDAALAAERAARSTDRGLRLRAFIAEGHHWFADGDMEQALEAFQDALLLDPESRVARHDYEVILRTLQGTGGDSDLPGGLTPEPGSTPAQPAPSATPGAGTPQPGPGEPTGTPEPGPTEGPGRGASREELESELAALDQLIQSLLQEQQEDGLTYEETLELLERIAERNRLSELLESLPRANDPLNR